MWYGVRSCEGAFRGSKEQVKEGRAVRGRPLNWNCLQVFNCKVAQSYHATTYLEGWWHHVKQGKADIRRR